MGPLYQSLQGSDLVLGASAVCLFSLSAESIGFDECKTCLDEDLCLECSSDVRRDSVTCGIAEFREQHALATVFYSARATMDVQNPQSYEDPVFAYPERTAASNMILENVENFIDRCPEATLVELMEDSERHLSLTAQTKNVDELRGNLSIACKRWNLFEQLVRGPLSTVLKSLHLPQIASLHLDRSWQRLGLAPARICILDALHDSTVPSRSFLHSLLDFGDVEIHSKCNLRHELGFDTGAAIGGGCRFSSFASSISHMLPPAAKTALESRAPPVRFFPGQVIFKSPADVHPASHDAPGNGCNAGREPHAQSSEVSFLSYWPYPVMTITRCKYCAAASLMNLRPGDRMLHFGLGTGLTSLRAAFGVDLAVVDAFREPTSAASAISSGSSSSVSAACAGEVAALASFQDGVFDAIVANSELRMLKPFAAQCATLRTHFVRLLRPGGVLWWGDVNSPDTAVEAREKAALWHACLAPLAKTGIVSYTMLPELDTFGVTETWNPESFSIFVVRLQMPSPPDRQLLSNALPPLDASSDHPASVADVETKRMAYLYGCPAAYKAGFSYPAEAAAALDAVAEVEATAALAQIARQLQSFMPGPAFWACVEARLRSTVAQAKALYQPAMPVPVQLAPRLWRIESFASDAEAAYLATLVVAWFEETQKQKTDEILASYTTDQDLWVDDMIVSTGLDGVLDALEDRLEEYFGLPRSHADPWHILRYKPGFRGYWPHTDCHHPGFNPENDRHVTALVWISTPAFSETCMKPELFDGTVNSSEDAAPAMSAADGATVFPHYNVRIKLGAGGLALYSSYGDGPAGSCEPSALHYAAPVAGESTRAKIVLQKWYYARPVEPSSPPTPRAPECKPLCKRYWSPLSSRSSEVQAWTAAAEELVNQPVQSLDGVREMLESNTIAQLRSVLQEELRSTSLGRSAHARAMYLLANFEIIAWQVGIENASAREAGLDRLRAALQRCPVCEDMLSLITRVLSDEAGVTAAVEISNTRAVAAGVVDPRERAQLAAVAVEREAREALAYARRLAAMGAPGAGALARAAANRLHVQL